MGAAQTNSTPKVSVIIPSYKTADLIAACLDSVFAQTFTDFEAIVVNDGSPDTPELERVLAPYRKRIVYIKQENKRAAGARNNAMRNARGEFVAFLDSDDSWLPNHLEAQIGLFAKDPGLVLAYSDAVLVGDPGREKKFTDQCPSVGEATFEALVLERCQIPISTVVARKAAMLDAGLFDETLPRCDDYDMWVRVAFRGGKIAYSRNLGARVFTGRPGSLGVSRARMLEAYWNMLEKFQRSLPLSEPEGKMVKQRAAEIRARYLVEEGKCKLLEHEFSQARQLISEANSYLHNSMLSLTVLGLRVAPSATGKFISFWNRIRTGTPA
jgi:glycosyltransferase involved in cell wall biosynthesis